MGPAASPGPLRLMGAPGSPYTRKMIALLRYRRIPYAILWGGHQRPPEGYPAPKVRLLPTFYFPADDGALEAVVDSTPIARRLEADYPGRSVIPDDPALRWLNELIEDFADEWLTKPMFHYRWAHQADILNAGPLLVYWSAPTVSPEEGSAMAVAFSERQIGRLHVVGSNDITAETIESSYRRLLGLLDERIRDEGYVFGARPATADFALYGQLTQLAIVEPTSAAIACRDAPRVRAWIDRVEDLSGLEPEAGDWLARDRFDVLQALLAEIGRVYVPFLLANAAAVQAGEKAFETDIDGRKWSQPTFPYQAKCLQWLQEGYRALGSGDRSVVDNVLEGTGCERLTA
ncbi:MAG: glutathione S-transferase [Alphaproteobacteria bacterium]|nr:glutathione S-transferase [Alphaproteobacteria bacterium]